MKEKQVKELILGIDDAGRGPVIGPMVLSGVLIDVAIEKEFKKLDVKDSKMLSAKRRDFLAKEVKNKVIDHAVVVSFPDEIDNRNSVGLNLNKIEAVKSADIINQINGNLKNKKQKIKVVIDCPSPNAKAWKNFLTRYVDNMENLEILCEHKADINHIACSAASILAKTTRESEIKKIKQEIGQDFGSGYSSDPVTIKFLEENFSKYKKHGIFRQTWQTVSNFKAKREQKKLHEF